MAYVVAVCSGAKRSEPKRAVVAGDLVAGYGLRGDAHAGQSVRQVSLLTMESIERANREQGIDAVPGSFAENLTIAGLDLLSLRLGDRLQVGPALLEVVQIGKPPEESTYSYHGLALLAREGVFCRVLEGGRVAGGDAVHVIRCDERPELCA